MNRTRTGNGGSKREEERIRNDEEGKKEEEKKEEEEKKRRKKGELFRKTSTAAQNRCALPHTETRCLGSIQTGMRYFLTKPTSELID